MQFYQIVCWFRLAPKYLYSLHHLKLPKSPLILENSTAIFPFATFFFFYKSRNLQQFQARFSIQKHPFFLCNYQTARSLFYLLGISNLSLTVDFKLWIIFRSFFLWIVSYFLWQIRWKGIFLSSRIIFRISRPYFAVL